MRLREVGEEGRTLTSYPSLRTDLLNAGADSAAALHVHRSTLRYRLGRIADLTGFDLRVSILASPACRYTSLATCRGVPKHR